MGIVIFCTKSWLLATAAFHSLVLVSAFGEDWVQRRAPRLYWQGVASSGDGARLVAAAYSDPSFGPAGLYVSTNSGFGWAITDAPFQFWQKVASSADGVRLVAAAYADAGWNPGAIYTSTNSG